jgi:hypothetical protein
MMSETNRRVTHRLASRSTSSPKCHEASDALDNRKAENTCHVAGGVVQMKSFTVEQARQIIEGLRSQGIPIAPGLTDEEVSAVEEAFHALMPIDLRVLLQTGMPEGDSFTNWRDPEGSAAWSRNHVEGAFLFDIQQNEYWSDLFGEKPTSIKAAMDRALEFIRKWPPLFPIYSHRFMPSEPHETGMPVWSVYQPVDTIIYGVDIIDYFNNEFRLGLPTTGLPPKAIPLWGDALGLNNE